MKHNGKAKERDRVGVLLLAYWRGLSPEHRRKLVDAARELAGARDWVVPRPRPVVIGGIW